jgi:hypothetical protein
MQVIKIKRFNQMAEIPVNADRFFIFLHGIKRHVWIDSITPDGVAVQIWTLGNRTNMKRKYLSHSTFYAIWMHRVV